MPEQIDPQAEAKEETPVSCRDYQDNTIADKKLLVPLLANVPEHLWRLGGNVNMVWEVLAATGWEVATYFKRLSYEPPKETGPEVLRDHDGDSIRRMKERYLPLAGVPDHRWRLTDWVWEVLTKAGWQPFFECCKNYEPPEEPDKQPMAPGDPNAAERHSLPSPHGLRSEMQDHCMAGLDAVTDLQNGRPGGLDTYLTKIRESLSALSSWIALGCPENDDD